METKVHLGGEEEFLGDVRHPITTQVIGSVTQEERQDPNYPDLFAGASAN